VVGFSCEGLEDQIVALLTAIEEDHYQEQKGAYFKSRGKRELLNLEFSINYDTTRAASRRGKGKPLVF
jgi:hypothetical protein